jgi:hypothetical protein
MGGSKNNVETGSEYLELENKLQSAAIKYARNNMSVLMSVKIIEPGSIDKKSKFNLIHSCYKFLMRKLYQRLIIIKAYQ